MQTESPDVLIVGAGACGSLVAKELQNSEANAAKIMWTEPRVYTGKDAIVPKAGVGVGGGTLVWLGVAPRFHPADFRTYSTDGVGADWPISYADLKPYYAKV